MATYTIIAGHGRNRDGSYDPGARGYGTTEADFIRNKLIPAMKKYTPTNHTVNFVTDKNVYSYGSLADYKGTSVTELHLDAFTANSRGGHVIVHDDFAPDKIDLAIRDVIAKYIGVRYTHKGHKGISGRADLANPNIAKSNGINYRLVECAFITNKQDMDALTKNLDNFAKDLVKAICGSIRTSVATPAPKPSKYIGTTHKVVQGDSLWAIGKKYGVSVANLKAWNNLKSDVIQPGQVLKLSKPNTTPITGSIGTVTVIVDQLWYYYKADWNAKQAIAKKGDVFTVVQKLKVDDAWMYKLKSGTFITANPQYVRFK